MMKRKKMKKMKIDEDKDEETANTILLLDVSCKMELAGDNYIF